MKIEYIRKKFTDAHLNVVSNANKIITEYSAQGYDLTLRQLYYQFVSRDLIPNTLQEYKRLGTIINDARLGGLISWESIVDRTRNLERNSHWDNPGSAVESMAYQYQIDKWTTQPNRVEVWVEKDALIGVIEKVCRQNDVSYFACRGYTSQSEMWSAAQRLIEYRENDQNPIIIHLGDHDPSGVDMTRDIFDRLNMFMEHHTSEGVEVNRIALNIDQIRRYNPPPNPAKITDARAASYIKKFGRQSWELDALEPKVLNDLIQNTINEYCDGSKWRARVKEQEADRKKLYATAKELTEE